jgi:hypothetical protein
VTLLGWVVVVAAFGLPVLAMVLFPPNGGLWVLLGYIGVLLLVCLAMLADVVGDML